LFGLEWQGLARADLLGCPSGQYSSTTSALALPCNQTVAARVAL
jgi:hypothetical protein